MSLLPPFRPVAVGALELGLQPVTAAAVASGSPRTGSVDLVELEHATIGVWEMTTGGMFDTETDEVFVVVSGAATVTPLEPDGRAAGESIDLRPGDLCRLTAGQRTRWDVSTPLRKLYVLGVPAGRSL